MAAADKKKDVKGIRKMAVEPVNIECLANKLTGLQDMPTPRTINQ